MVQVGGEGKLGEGGNTTNVVGRWRNPKREDGRSKYLPIQRVA